MTEGIIPKKQTYKNETEEFLKISKKIICFTEKNEVNSCINVPEVSDFYDLIYL